MLLPLLFSPLATPARSPLSQGHPAFELWSIGKMAPVLLIEFRVNWPSLGALFPRPVSTLPHSLPPSFSWALSRPCGKTLTRRTFFHSTSSFHFSLLWLNLAISRFSSLTFSSSIFLHTSWLLLNSSTLPWMRNLLLLFYVITCSFVAFFCINFDRVAASFSRWIFFTTLHIMHYI